ncbi:hypothetical protein Tco_1224228, partial [Tanacetum coccineum]
VPVSDFEARLMFITRDLSQEIPSQSQKLFPFHVDGVGKMDLESLAMMAASSAVENEIMRKDVRPRIKPQQW